MNTLAGNTGMTTPVFDYLSFAQEIAATLTRTAIHHDHQCTWFGRDASEMLNADSPLIPTLRSLGGDLYSGSAGVALFLAEFAGVGLAHGRTEETARGAIAHALRQTDCTDSSVASSGGFFAGLGGVGYAAFRVGTISSDEKLVGRGFELMTSGVERCIETRNVDVIGGLAGLVLMLASLARHEVRVEVLLERAGTALKALAERDREYWRWPVERPLSEAQRHFLTGFSHGTSGIAAALYALHRTTGDGDALLGARCTLETEDTWFIDELQNWPDLRTFAESSLPLDARRRRAMKCGTTWCHGAPGILLTRALGGRIEGTTSLSNRHVAAALHTTSRAVRDWAPDADVSPCHGVVGLLEILLAVSAAFGDEERQEIEELTRRVARKLTCKFRGVDWWPSGVPSGGANPSFMLGMAGVGYHFVRWAHPDRVPSILLPD
jgi:lantibiotic modifying enzyme